ncbi:MAG: AlkA N-terminal domain-containing protein [Alphaproteobacteria bacterium]
MIPDRQTCYSALLARDTRFDGRFFTAVKTTGIYCRPVCPVRPPKLENCIFLPSAAAAQAAGFRSCLRCRPESAPDTGAWRGTYATVSRALALIEDGALDEGAVERLSARLGVGERHLRRLFLRHIGASPTAVAHTRRVLFAKQLITETRLGMTEIALASGFGSIRRFNEVFQKLFGRPPGALRKKLPCAGTGPHSIITLSLPYRAPYDWEMMLNFLSSRAIPGIEAIHDGAYRRTILLEGRAGWVEVTHNARQCALRATISCHSVKQLPIVIAKLRRLFDVGADPLAIGAALSCDPHLRGLVCARPGLRVPGAWDGFEVAVRAILGQQITVSAATRLAGKLVAAFGSELPDTSVPSGLSHLFPSAAQLANQDVAQIGMPRTRGATIAGLAAASIADPHLFGRYQSLQDAVERLRSLPGIGEWTAQYIAMRALRESDAFPAGDVALMRALTKNGSPRISAPVMLLRAEAWRPWRAYAALHLWTSDAAAIPVNGNKDLRHAFAD